MEMPQISIYLSEEVNRELRLKARKARKSFSAYLVDLARKDLRPTSWPDAFSRLYGSCAGELSEIGDLRPEDIEPL